MKVKHVLMIATVLLAMLAMPIAADTVVTYSSTAPYEVDIPPSMTVDVTGTIGVSGVLDANTQVRFSVDSANQWNLSLGDKDYLDYRLYDASDVEITNYNDVLVATAEELATSGEKKLSATAKLVDGEEPKYRGDYTDVLTFTVTQEAQDGTSVLIRSYAELKEFIDTAAVGTEVKCLLINNIEVPQDKSLTIENGQQIVLDLNGHTISGTCNSPEGWLMFVENSAILTIKDSIGSGKLKFTKGTSGTGWVIDLEGKLVLESGTIELAGNGWDIGYCVDVRPNAWGTAYTEPTIFTMNGGKLVSSDGAVRVASSSSDTYSDVSASFVMTNGEIDAAYDGIFIQQSNGAYDTLSFTMTGGSIISDNYLIRFYGPGPTSYISDNQKCMSLTLNVDVSALTGPADPLTGKTWLIENVIALGGGMTSDIIDNTATITLDDSFNDNP